MDNHQEALPDAAGEDPEFTGADWQSDVDAFFGDGGDDTPKQPDEFTASEFAAYRRMSNNGAQNKLMTLMQQGKVTRRMARGSGRMVYYYRVVKPAVQDRKG